MSSTLRRPSFAASRKPSLASSGAGGSIGNIRSALILTSAASRDGHVGRDIEYHENTYQLAPCKQVTTCQLETIIRDVLTENLKDSKYTENSGTMTKSLAERMKEKAKELGIPRYKYVSIVVLGPSKHAAVSLASRCVWNPNFDTFAEYTYKNDELYATGVIFGVYVE